MNQNSEGTKSLVRITFKFISVIVTIAISLLLLQEAGFAQQTTQNDNTPLKTLSALPTKGKPPLYTYYALAFPLDGHLVVPTTPNGPNFLACDKSLLTVVDLTKLHKSNRIDCGFSPADEPGVLTAYLNSTKNGTVVLLTKNGKKSISEFDWKKLLQTYSDQTQASGNKFDIPKVGDYVAVTKSQNGQINEIYKLAKTKRPQT